LERARDGAARHDHGRGRHGAGDPQGYRGGNGASVQYGSGSIQGARGNQAGQGSGNRQFDRTDWTGPGGDDSRHDVRSRPGDPGVSDRADDTGLREPVHPHIPDDVCRPFTQNNRRGTHAILSPSLVYAARNRSGRILSPRVADATAAMLARSPLVRFSLHPPDGRYPELVRHIQHVLERLLEQREAVTKAEFARRLTRFTNTDTAGLPTSPDPSRNSPGAPHSAGHRISY
jgi:hypothetical protein